MYTIKLTVSGGKEIKWFENFPEMFSETLKASTGIGLFSQ